MVLESVVRRRSMVAGFRAEVIRRGFTMSPSSAISLLAFKRISEEESTVNALAAQPPYEGLVLVNGGWHWWLSLVEIACVIGPGAMSEDRMSCGRFVVGVCAGLGSRIRSRSWLE
jgi:hypothetical protein